METLFDFNPTPEEWDALFGEDFGADDYRDLAGGTFDPVSLWKLFDLRDDIARRDHYAQFIDPEELNSSLAYNDLIS